jgi:1-deoxy-D-xylulose-5-phosphate reductoisomerase
MGAIYGADMGEIVGIVLFQALGDAPPDEVHGVTITASGGPFRAWPFERIARATLAEALRHPNFAMGQRITIDSASMLNKAMELIETKEFFGLPPEKIKVVIHPEQIIHALVAFRDGAVMAHMGAPDMRHAIGYALHWPERGDVPVPRLDLALLGRLTFEAPDPRRYPALALATEVMRLGGRSGAAFNAAKEAALDAFIAGRIHFTAMAGVVEATLDALAAGPDLTKPPESLDEVLQMDHVARGLAAQITDFQQART